MTIRQLGSEDAAAFQALRLAALQECPEAFTSSHAEEVDTPQEVVARRLSANPDGAVFGEIANGRLVGIVGIQRETRRKVAHKAFIWGMYVAPDHRNNGTGRALLARALAHAAGGLGTRVVQLGVNARNEAAVALYRAGGFEIYGTESEFMIVDGVAQDQYLMSRRVP
jgi:ribosomal protein S18 acetylase RimI-like enzyme